MRVALVTDNFDPLAGGLEKWTVSLAAYLLEKGHDVWVLAFGEANHVLPVSMTILPPRSRYLAARGGGGRGVARPNRRCRARHRRELVRRRIPPADRITLAESGAIRP